MQAVQNFTMEPIGCHETSLNTYQNNLRNNLEEEFVSGGFLEGSVPFFHWSYHCYDRMSLFKSYQKNVSSGSQFVIAAYTFYDWSLDGH
jgi:hypothetical protein